jgi:dethiobiotin synthetase
VKSLFVTATNTDVGKTYTTLKIIELLGKQGISVGICKPIETGVVDEPLDATLLLKQVQKYNKNFQHLKPKEITAYTFELPSAPFCADIHNSIQTEQIKKKIHDLGKLCDVLII